MNINNLMMLYQLVSLLILQLNM